MPARPTSLTAFALTAWSFVCRADGPAADRAWEADAARSAAAIALERIQSRLVDGIQVSDASRFRLMVTGKEDAPGAAAPDWQLASEHAEIELGYVLAAADIDRDGCDDLVVGARGFPSSEGWPPGAIWVFHGSHSGLETSPRHWFAADITDLRLGQCLAIAGGESPEDSFRIAAGLRGLEDIPGRPGYGVIFELTDISTMPVKGPRPLRPTRLLDSTSAKGPAPQGQSISAAGDVNGDGYGDLVLGVPNAGERIAFEGAAMVFHGGAHGFDESPAWSAVGGRDDTRLGFEVAGIGDVDGDGFDDVAIGAPRFSTEFDTHVGLVRIHHGSTDGLGREPAWEAVGDSAFGWLGASIARAGDVNGDGFDDVWIAAPGAQGGRFRQGSHVGRAHLYLGSPTGVESPPALTIADPTGPWTRLGACIAAVGDLDGDGPTEYAIGAPNSGIEEVGEGRVHLISIRRGSDGLPEVVRELTFAGGEAQKRLGYSVCPEADFNGDGLSDLVIGSPMTGRRGDAQGSLAKPTTVTVWYGGPDIAARLGAEVSAPSRIADPVSIPTMSSLAASPPVAKTPSASPTDAGATRGANRHALISTLAAGAIAAIAVVAIALARRRRQVDLAAVDSGITASTLEDERRRLAQDLHDHLGAEVGRLEMMMSTRHANKSAAPGHVLPADRLREIEEGLRRLNQDIREIAWATNPQNDRLVRIVDFLCDQARGFADAAGIECRIDAPIELPDIDVGWQLHRHLRLSLKESMFNAIRHGLATRITLLITVGEKSITLAVEDNGHGMPEAVEGAPGHRGSRGHGLENMQKRAAELHGSMTVESIPGTGTRIVLEAPLATTT